MSATTTSAGGSGGSMSSSETIDALAMEFGKILLVMFIGYLCDKTSFLKIEKKQLSQLLAKIVLPAVFFFSSATVDLTSVSIAGAIAGLFGRIAMMCLFFIPAYFLKYKQSFKHKIRDWAMFSLFVTMVISNHSLSYFF